MYSTVSCNVFPTVATRGPCGGGAPPSTLSPGREKFAGTPHSGDQIKTRGVYPTWGHFCPVLCEQVLFSVMYFWQSAFSGLANQSHSGVNF
jgi:hypothetical protein